MKYITLEDNLLKLNGILLALPSVIQNSGYKGPYNMYRGSGKYHLEKTMKRLKRLLVVVKKQNDELRRHLLDELLDNLHVSL